MLCVWGYLHRGGMGRLRRASAIDGSITDVLDLMKHHHLTLFTVIDGKICNFNTISEIAKRWPFWVLSKVHS